MHLTDRLHTTPQSAPAEILEKGRVGPVPINVTLDVINCGPFTDRRSAISQASFGREAGINFRDR